MKLASLKAVPLRMDASRPARSRRFGDGGDVGSADDNDDMANAGNEAPLFVVKVEHGQRRGDYVLRVRLEPRDDLVTVFHRHRLTAIRVYVDSAREREIEAWQEKLRGDKRDGYRQAYAAGNWVTKPVAALDFFLSPAWVVTTVRQAYAAHQHGKVLRISVGDLLHGVTLTGSLEELHGMEAELLAKVDWLAARIASGVAYDSAEIAIYAPGKRGKPPSPPDDSGTPPNEWRP